MSILRFFTSRSRIVRIIEDYPDVLDRSIDFEFERAEKAINDFTKATGDEERTTDLMIYFVERVNQFTLDYGDIDEVFYDTLIEMNEKAVARVRKMQKKKQRPFRNRLERIMKSTGGIGWGYHPSYHSVDNHRLALCGWVVLPRCGLRCTGIVPLLFGACTPPS